jgi:BirA family biotin operon repressor/biotin-[acetyl-CoA-carboxylase] ligase
MQGVVSLNLKTLRDLLQTQLLGVDKRLFYVPEVVSTNTLAMKLAHERPEEGLVVLTDSQTAGKGRQGRRWNDTPRCNVLSSTLLRPLFPPHLLVMLASLAVVDAIAQTCGLRASIKWPNDVLIGERKVCGILIETSRDPHGDLFAVLGIGINTNGHIQGQIERKGVEVELASFATTLETACGHPVNREKLLANLLLALEQEYLSVQKEALSLPRAIDQPAHIGHSIGLQLQARWQRHLSTLGRTVQVHQGDQPLEGIAEALDEDGELLLRLSTGELVHITWGVVEHSPS